MISWSSFKTVNRLLEILIALKTFVIFEQTTFEQYPSFYSSIKPLKKKLKRNWKGRNQLYFVQRLLQRKQCRAGHKFISEDVILGKFSRNRCDSGATQVAKCNRTLRKDTKRKRKGTYSTGFQTYSSFQGVQKDSMTIDGLGIFW